MAKNPDSNRSAYAAAAEDSPTVEEQQLLAKLLEQSLRLGAGVSLDKFRADHYGQVAAINRLEEQNFIRRQDDRYIVQPTVLPLVDSPLAQSLLTDIELIYTALRRHYVDAQKTPVQVISLTTEVRLPRERVAATLQLMCEVSLWWSGRTSDLSRDEAFVTPAERILESASFADMTRVVRSWSAGPQAALGGEIGSAAAATRPLRSRAADSTKKEPLQFATAFDSYTVVRPLGEGGAGRVFLATSSAGENVAIKVLLQSTADKRQRFKNEIGFLRRIDPHDNIVSWLGDGYSTDSRASGPFYVMPAYDGSLRDLLREGVSPALALDIFSQVLSGVEVAHSQRAVHRDLKPENFLFRRSSHTVVVAVADFGIARFHPEDQETQVETKEGSRLANFDYHAPEQRRRGADTDARTDLFALGLILNELFTGAVPRGSGFKRIAQAAPEYAFLDELVELMMQSEPALRPRSIADVRRQLISLRELAGNRSRTAALPSSLEYSELTSDPLLLSPIEIAAAEWKDGTLTLELSQPVNEVWVECLRGSMGSWESVMGAGPERFSFTGTQARVAVSDDDAQRTIDYFKSWLPKVSAAYAHELRAGQQHQAQEEVSRLALERARIEREQRVNSHLRI